MLTVPQPELKAKVVTELVAVTDLTITNHTEFKELNTDGVSLAVC
jgi:hypothetical protein